MPIIDNPEGGFIQIFTDDEAVIDAAKSLNIYIAAVCKVLGVDFETPPDPIPKKHRKMLKYLLDR